MTTTALLKGKHRIRKMTEKKKLCFILMPFKAEMKEVYEKGIKPGDSAAC